METLAVSAGIRSVDQPFSVFSASSDHLGHLPDVPCGEFIDPTPIVTKALKSYVDGLVAGNVRHNTPWRVWQDDFHFRTNRLLLKIVSAKALIEWFEDQFACRIVYLLRHPIPVALSILRNRWGPTAPAYLASGAFCERYLTTDQESACKDIFREGRPLDVHVMNWGLENLVPLRRMALRPSWQLVSYEQMTLEPIRTVQRLAEDLGLDDIERMLRRARRPSRSTRRASTPAKRARIRKTERRNVRTALVRGWRESVSPAEERRALAVLDVLDVPVYVPGEDRPRI
jgi:hypothetical protein